MARRRRDGGTVLLPALISWHLKSSSILLQASCTRARLHANLHSNLLAVRSKHFFLPLRGPDVTCDGASRRGKIYSRGRRAEKGFRYAPQVRKHAARRGDTGYQGAIAQVSTEPQGHRYVRRARFTLIYSVQFCRDMRVSVMICVVLDEL